MKIHRFFCLTPPEPLAKGGSDNRKITDGEVLAQMQRVLKLKNGEQIVLAKGDSTELLAEIINIKTGEVKVLEERKNENEPAKHVILYCAVLKRENFEMVCQKATEIGVKEIVPVITRRTVKLDIKKDRLEKIIKEAAEQSGRGMMPVLNEPMAFEDVVKKAEGVNILADASGGPATAAHGAEKLGIWIGPEGGWEAAELEAAKNAGMQIATLGKRTLRAETAAIVACYLAVGG